MTANILVVTYDSPMGEFIRAGLEERGRFNLQVTRELKQAVTFLLETDCTLAVIDPGENMTRIPPVLRRLRETRPALQVIMLVETGWQELLEEIKPDVTIYKPFSLPELQAAVGKIYPLEIPPPPTPLPESAQKLPAWLSDVNRAVKRLKQLSLESFSQAALITQGDELWAYAGILRQEAALELAATIARYWDREEENDLVRYIHLACTGAELMLYATRLAPGKVLTLVFDAETPYSMIRSQASQLKQSLSASTEEDEMEEPAGFGSLDSTPSRSADAPSPQTTERGTADLPKYGETDPLLHDAAWQLFSTTRSGSGQEEYIPLGAEGLAPISAPSLFQRFGIDSGNLAAQPVINPAVNADMMDQAAEEEGAQGFIPVPRKLVLESATASVYNLDYVCVLIPRFTHHLLTGELSERLGDWLPQICQAFTWRLEYISIRPEFLQWIASVPPASSPAYFMRILRQHTSEKIFLEFPRYKRENPSGDFWAPGYLIMGGTQPPPSQLIKDYIAQTRHRQGISQI